MTLSRKCAFLREKKKRKKKRKKGLTRYAGLGDGICQEGDSGIEREQASNIGGASTNTYASIGNENSVECIRTSENGVADTKEDIACPCATGQIDSRIHGGSEGGPDLEDELCIDVATSIEGKCAGYTG